MTKYREILRLTALGLSQRNIMQSINVSQKNVVKVQRRAREMNLSWPLDEYSRAVTPQIRQAGNRLSGLAETAYASLLA